MMKKILFSIVVSGLLFGFTHWGSTISAHDSAFIYVQQLNDHGTIDP